MDLPVLQFFYWLVNTAGVGGLAVAFVGGGSLLAYGLTLRWIAAGSAHPESAVYSYPTPALHGHGAEEVDEKRQMGRRSNLDE
jgi:hypothetical protein